MTVADPLSPDWQLPVEGPVDVAIGGPADARAVLLDPGPRHLSAVPEPVPAAVFAAIAGLVPAPRTEPAVAAAAPVDLPASAVVPVPRSEGEVSDVRALALAALRELARD